MGRGVSIMHINAKMLLGVILTSIMSACVVPQDGDTPDSEAINRGFVAQSESSPVPEGHAISVPDPALRPTPDAATTDCDVFPIVNIFAYNGTLGQAICGFGYTFVPNYANQ